MAAAKKKAPAKPAKASLAAPAKTPPVAPKTGDLLPFKAERKTLANGLEVLVVPTGLPNIVSIQIPVQTGSRNEVEAGKTGFAHFFEHMMYRGTKTMTPAQYQEILTKAGARDNAYTTDDYTNYHLTFAKEDLETMLRLEADRFQNLSYEESAFKTEARAVLGEYNKNASEPINKLDEVIRNTAYSTHTYKHTTMGFLKDVEDMPNQFAYSKVFFDRWYRPEYTTVIVAGDVVPAQVFKLVEKYWGGWKRGSFKVAIPEEPAARGAKAVHVPWDAPTLPWVTVSFPGPAFSETDKTCAAADLLVDLWFGETSDLYKKLVESEQKIDRLYAFAPRNADPDLIQVFARLKKPEDALFVRDQILKTVARAKAELLPEERVAAAKKNARYGLLRGLDTTEKIAGLLARFVRYRRSFDSLNAYYRVFGELTPQDLQAVARRFFVDDGLVFASLSQKPLAKEVAALPKLATFAPREETAALDLVVRKGPSPQIVVKLLFQAGSARDPRGKEGLASLSAAMVTEGGSGEKRNDEITRALFPMAASFSAQVDKEMATLTAVVHKDNWEPFFDLVLPVLTDPGLRDDDFKRLRDSQRNGLVQDLRESNDEELGKERLQGNVFAGTPYAHPPLGTVAGIDALTLEDVKGFLASQYTRKNLTVGISGDVPDALVSRLSKELAKLPEGAAPEPIRITPVKPLGLEVEIVEKETRATAISIGHPIEVTRSHPDFAALSVARAWLGEHRSSMARLFQTIREVRGMNYGDYAYIEAFPRGMYQFVPDANLARRAQLFEIWVRPVPPEKAAFTLRLALHELSQLVANGLSEADFQATRSYLMKSVYLLTATQDHDLGYALDSKWYGMNEYTTTMRERLAKLTRDDVNRAIRKHLTARDLSIVFVTKDAQALSAALLSAGPATITYDAPKPPEVLEEDKRVGAIPLSLTPEAIRVTKVTDVFGR
ncbi:MAG: insulinase family protein [Acidobacteria bacterium]|nr:insulinase family protein [Acidobacteriota bacterium]